MRKVMLSLVALLIISTSFNAVSAAFIVPAPSPIEKPDPAIVRAAMESFKNLPNKERKAKIKDVKKELKAFKALKKAGKEPSTNTILLVILAILLPPLAVYLHQGEINKKFWISLLLTLLFWLPGVIYALIVILGNGG